MRKPPQEENKNDFVCKTKLMAQLEKIDPEAGDSDEHIDNSFDEEEEVEDDESDDDEEEEESEV